MTHAGAATRLSSIGLGWAAIWLAFWTAVVAVIALVDPDSVDPGEPAMFGLIFGGMGLATGGLFAWLLSRASRDPVALPSWTRAFGCGLLATGLVQGALLGHGDRGLAANVVMALLFTGIGGVVTAFWLMLARMRR